MTSTRSAVPRYEDLFNSDGTPKLKPMPKPTLRGQARSLVRDIPAMADSLNAVPGGAVVAAPIKGLARAVPAVASAMNMTRRAAPAAAPSTRAANPVMSGLARDEFVTRTAGIVKPADYTANTLSVAGQTMPAVGRVVAARRYRKEKED